MHGQSELVAPGRTSKADTHRLALAVGVATICLAEMFQIRHIPLDVIAIDTCVHLFAYFAILGGIAAFCSAYERDAKRWFPIAALLLALAGSFDLVVEGVNELVQQPKIDRAIKDLNEIAEGSVRTSTLAPAPQIPVSQPRSYTPEQVAGNVIAGKQAMGFQSAKDPGKARWCEFAVMNMLPFGSALFQARTHYEAVNASDRVKKGEGTPLWAAVFIGFGETFVLILLANIVVSIGKWAYAKNVTSQNPGGGNDPNTRQQNDAKFGVKDHGWRMRVDRHPGYD